MGKLRLTLASDRKRIPIRIISCKCGWSGQTDQKKPICPKCKKAI